MTAHQISAALRSRFAAFASVAIVGCAIGANVAAAPAALHVGMAIPLVSPLSGELLVADNVQIACALRGAGFTASGTALGPYPGTFTVQGHWGFGLPYAERFTIMPRSGAVPISGSITVPASVIQANCQSYPRARGVYRSGSMSGSEDTDTIRSGVPLVQQFH